MENEFWQNPAIQKSALLSVAEMYRADQMAPCPSWQLMEKAGQGIATKLLEHFNPSKVLILCGPGNNGGDGFVVGRLLREANIPVRLALVGEITALKGDAAINAQRFEGEILPLSPELITPDELVVDALLGAGLCRPLAGLLKAVVDRINAIAPPVLSVDIPSGINGDDGETMGAAVKAQLTVTFFRKKPGHLLYPGKAYCGEIEVVDIGIPDKVIEEIKPRIFDNSTTMFLMPAPDWASHKYSRGHALIIGSERMSGAARLAARAVRRVGAGLCTVAAPSSSLMLYALSAPGGLNLALDKPADLVQILEDRRKNAVLIGPGLGVNAQTREYLEIILKSGRPVVLDADALSLLAENPPLLSPNHVITPHQGEFSRLFPKIKGSRLDMAMEAAALSRANIVLKGAGTIIASPAGIAFINSVDSPYLATAGSGDVLAGIITGLLAQGLDSLEAAALGTCLHGLCGLKLGPGLIAEDLPEILPTILGEFLC